MSDTRKIGEKCSAAIMQANAMVPAMRLLNFPSTAAVSRSARVAILVGEGVDEASVKTIYGELLAYGAQPFLVGCDREKVVVADNISLGIDIFIGVRRPMLFEATVIPEGESFVKTVEHNTFILNFMRQQYHHCKPILAIGAASLLLEKFDISPSLPSGLSDPSIIIGASAQLKKAVAELKVMLPN